MEQRRRLVPEPEPVGRGRGGLSQGHRARAGKQLVREQQNRQDCQVLIAKPIRGRTPSGSPRPALSPRAVIAGVVLDTRTAPHTATYPTPVTRGLRPFRRG